MTGASVPGFDHVIIGVHDLAAAAAGFAEAGFTVTRRRDAAGDGPAASENRLVVFPDGSYLELLTFHDAGAARQHRFWPRYAAGPGLLDVALRADALEPLREALAGAALPARGPLCYGKTLEDGEPWEVELLLAGIGVGDPTLPFFARDLTARSLRVPPAARAHAVPVGGIAGVTMLTSDLGRSHGPWQALFGAGEAAAGLGGGRAWRYRVGPSWVTLSEPGADEAAKAHLRRRGEGPYGLTLAGAPGADRRLVFAAAGLAVAVAGPEQR